MNSCANVNNGTKLRGTKSSELQDDSTTGYLREIDLEKNDKADKLVRKELDSDSIDLGTQRGTLVICQRNSGDHSSTRYKPRSTGSTRNESRMARGGTGSSNEHGRSGTRGRAFKKSSAADRDANTETGYHAAARGKLQESLKNQDNCQSRCYDDKRINEDSRITKLLRRLCREDDYEHFLGLCKQIQESALATENQRSIRRNLELICESLFDLLRTGPGIDAKQQVAKCLANIAYVTDQDFKRYTEWIFNKYSSERKDEVKCLLMKSLVETLKLNSETPKLKDFSVTIMSRLQSTLENVDRPDLLISTVDAILLVIDSYPETFSNHFRDSVDILVGWHIDYTQPKAIVSYASRSLQRLRNFWIADLPFTLTLLGQFLEDMESYDEELCLPGSGRSSPGEDSSPGPRECILRIASLISVFNTVTKSVAEHLNPSLTPIVQWSFLTDCLQKMLRTVVKAIELNEKEASHESVSNNHVESSQRSTESLTECMRSMNLSQKNIDTLLKAVSENNELNEEHLFRMLKSLNISKKGERKNSRIVVEGKDILVKDKERYLVNLLKSVDSKRRNNERNLDLSQEKEELIIVSNECAYLLLGYLQSRVPKNHHLLYKFIDLQLEKVDIFTDGTVVSTLTTIAKVIREVSANLPLDIVHKLLGQNSVILKLRFVNSIAIQNASLDVYHSLLGLKNIPLLQEAYRYVLADFEIAYKVIVHDADELVTDNPLTDVTYHKSDAQTVVVFLLRALTDLANASNSIIGMWALKPSILELLAVKLRPYDRALSAASPLLQYSILYLLYAHCSRYNHFVRSSCLITGTNTCRPIDIFPGALDVPTTSPTSGHLSIILDLIATAFETKLEERTISLLSKWMREVCIQAESYLGILSKTEELRAIVASLLKRGSSTNPTVSLAVCDNLEILINDDRVIWPEHVYTGIVKLAMLNLTSYHESVRTKYGQLLTNVPINIVISLLNKQCLRSETKRLRTIERYSIESLIIAERLHMRGSNNNTTTRIGEMQGQHLKSYMAFLLQDYDFTSSDLSEIFTLCWPTVSSFETVVRMRELGLTNRSFLYFWSGMEAAHHCVINKLRTPLGKPQETFTTIEGALKALARETQGTTRNEDTRAVERNSDNDFHEHTRVRMLVEFWEHLERSIHNASEGCAVALLPLPKPVRTFFHTNKSTCKEWLNRVRLALCVVALYAGLSTSALRNAQRFLESLCNAELTQGVEFERTVMCTATALVKLGETEALQGLYVWTKEKERKFDWLKAAVEEAAGRYEAASEHYERIIESINLSNEEKSPEEVGKSMKVEIIAFAMEHLTSCYRATCDWDALEVCKTREIEILKDERNIGLHKYISKNLTAEQARSLKKFHNRESVSLEELSDWSLLEDKNTGNWSTTRTMVECSNTLTNIAMRLVAGENKKDVFTVDINRCRKIAAMVMEEGLRNAPSEHLTDAILVQYASRCLTDIISESSKPFNVFQLSMEDNMNHSPYNPDCKALSEILWWSDYYTHMTSDTTSDERVESLRLDMIKSARKTGNFKLASRQIVKYFRLNQESLGGLALSENSTLDDIKSLIIDNRVHAKWTINSMRAFRQISKLLYSMDKLDDALKISSATALGISESIVNGEQSSSDVRETGTRLLLTLSEWIQPNVAIDDNEQLNDLLRFEAQHNDGLMDKLFGQTIELIPRSDMIIGKLIQLGVNQCPELSVAWSSFAGWCYKWGHKIVDDSKAGQLTDADRANIHALLPHDIRESDTIAILSILSQNNSMPEDETVMDKYNLANTSEMIEKQLRNVGALSRASSQHLSLLVDIWRQAQKRIYSYYELSANAYFKYLQLANSDSNDCASITATLRLLRLVVKHAQELQNVLESGLSTTPTTPWKEIIPQLFSRLSHPESYVRTRVSDLLCRIARNTPHLIIFPAVVGVFVEPRRAYNNNETKSTAILNADDEEEEGVEDNDYDEENNDEDDDHEDKEKDDLPQEHQDPDVLMIDELPTENDDIEEESVENLNSVMMNNSRDSCPHHLGDEERSCMEACFAQLNDCLESSIEDSVTMVKVLVKELRRITLLWDELWLATFCQHHREIANRFEQLELEVEKVQNNMMLSQEEKDKLIAEKHRIILTPVIFILENLVAVTSGPAETPHEAMFLKKFGPCIEDVIQRLKSPKNPSRPRLTFAPLKQLEAKLAQKVNKRGFYTLSMADISPILANMRDTGIAMPGVSRIDKKIVTIRSVDNNVQILPTKTKPKKLVFHGSDGHVYTYLFKGLEDLHLDERIMQFLSICNTMISKSNDSRKVYRARHYSVIPLGPRSGLIQWVDGVTPLFTLYKRWLQRESAMTNSKGGQSSVMGPSDLFYNKLAPHLKERGIPLENRKEWPLPVLKQVLSDLMAETPNDLLAKEIWCNSINSGNWWQATKNYSYSVAVMSIIGYIIGLGDRHLDNVLVDLNTGEVVHVDYNVCFEKGKILRVPEKVPFRMTPNIKHALGVTGVEGIFRMACEHTLLVMRRGRETLLTLLEAFVYDPLVDWRAGSENGIATYGGCQAKDRCTGIGIKQLEKELTRAMFAVRAAEIRAEWLSNRDRLAAILPLLSRELTGWLEATETSRQCQDLLQDRHQQLHLVKEAQAIGPSHALYSVKRRYSTFKRARDAHEKAKNDLKEKMEECEKQIAMHNIALTAVRGGQLSRWILEIGTPAATRDEHLVFDLVKEFLQNAGQNQSIVQCEQSENELIQLATQQSLLIRNCLDLLSQYSAICSLYPLTTMSQHRSVLYHTWADNLLNTGNLETCREIVARCEANMEQIMPNDPRSQQAIAFAYQMQAIMNDCNEKFKKHYERMVSEGLPDTVVRIEKAYVESRQQITNFLRREKGAERALECVNVTALCALNKRYLMMEGAAKCAGECLVDLTSREGDWFLDEMRLMSSLIVQLASLVPPNLENLSSIEKNNVIEPDIAINLSFKCLRSADAIYKGLQELNYNYQMIILPEALKTIVTEEPSVLRMINELDEIIVSTGLPLIDIVAQLEMHLRFTLMDMESPHAIVQTIVDAVRLRFEALLSRQADTQELNLDESLTPGQMLLMGFNGLFEKLQMEGNALVAMLSSLDIPPSWNKIDQIRDAKAMAAMVLNESARRVLDDMFLIKRLQTIQESFAMCRDIATAYKGGLANVYDDERLNKPVKTFTADYVSRQLLGITSQTLAIAICFLLQRMGLNVNTEIEQRDIGAESKVSIEELCRKMVDSCLKIGLFSGSVLGQASALSSALEGAWRRKQTARLLQQGVEVARSSLQRLQFQLTAHNWLHEDSLMVRSNLNPINPLNRSTFMLELRKTAATLSGLQSRVCEAREKQQNLVASVDQRLKWAAGANPALGEVMAAFDNAVLTSCEKLTRQHNLAAIVVNTCNSILHYEALRTRTSESISNDANFLKLTKQWEESCLLRVNLTTSVTLIEESLVELLQLENNVDGNWLRRGEIIISDAIVETNKLLQEKQAAQASSEDTLRERVSELQCIIMEHHWLMTDVRVLLRTMLKKESIAGLDEFLTDYRSFTEAISAVVKELESDNLDPSRVVEVREQLENVTSKVSTLYDRLLEFANEPATKTRRKAKKSSGTSGKGKKLIRQDTSVCLSPRKGIPLVRDRTTGKAVQERNVYALNVWRRVRGKLKGYDPNPLRMYTPAEQVEYVIREAQSFDNLALLYEGWTPWV
ncbi:serine/threonine-protein kinase SMG1 isoform X1 [Venturia canescens]|uniref:serine/threonine-protein kinase SMG1 isoform X1 n=1 Tax=Venturia canescens TaxID=32260 RepID=UPI001C9C5059|nr:serine/threonine-protein kinase SMG1 isoform X1 [Venturia canescens]